MDKAKYSKESAKTSIGAAKCFLRYFAQNGIIARISFFIHFMSESVTETKTFLNEIPVFYCHSSSFSCTICIKNDIINKKSIYNQQNTCYYVINKYKNVYGT